MCWIDDRQVNLFVGSVGILMVSYVQSAGTMTSFATDRGIVNLDAKASVLGRFNSTGMTIQTTDVRRSLERAVVRGIITRRHGPGLFRRVPRDRRFHEKAVRLDKVAARVVSRANPVFNRIVRQHRFRIVEIDDRFAMSHLALLAIDLIFSTGSPMEELDVSGLVLNGEFRECLAVRRS